MPTGPREERISRRLRRTFPIRIEGSTLERLLLSYARFPSIHRVAISPENLWVAFFDGGRAGLVITQRHFDIRTGRAVREGAVSPAPAKRKPRAAAHPGDPADLTPAQRRRLQESI
jgi:hypothetical protein